MPVDELLVELGRLRAQNTKEQNIGSARVEALEARLDALDADPASWNHDKNSGKFEGLTPAAESRANGIVRQLSAANAALAALKRKHETAEKALAREAIDALDVEQKGMLWVAIRAISEAGDADE